MQESPGEFKTELKMGNEPRGPWGQSQPANSFTALTQVPGLLQALNPTQDAPLTRFPFLVKIWAVCTSETLAQCRNQSGPQSCHMTQTGDPLARPL